MSSAATTLACVYVFEGGYPTPETVQRAYDDADLNRAVQVYRFFFPTVAVSAGFGGPRQGAQDGSLYGVEVRWSGRS